MEGLVFIEGGLQFLLGVGVGGWEAMTLYGDKDRALRPVLQIAMPRSPCIYAPLKRNHPSGRRRGIIPVAEQIRKVGM